MLKKQIPADTEITIHAKVAGRLWWPQDRVEFPVSVTFHTKPSSPFQNEFHGLREALLQVQNDGNYQNLDFIEPVEISVKRKTYFVNPDSRLIEKTVERRRTLTIDADHPEYSDLFEREAVNV